MAVTYNNKKVVDISTWHWMNANPQGSFFGGQSSAYDGSRYIYWAVQRGTSTNGSASTTELLRYDTWSNGWQLCITLTNATGSLDIEYDSVRAVIWIVEASSTSSTSWRFFNPSTTTAVTLGGQTGQPFALSPVITTVLPAATTSSTSEATIETINDAELPDALPLYRDITTSALTGTPTTTSLTDTSGPEFHIGMIGCYARLTSGALSGQSRLITAVPNSTTLTVQAFGTAPVAAVTYKVEVPGGLSGTALACSGTQTASTIQASAAQGWPTNIYRDCDVIIVAGTGNGQRRRIGSNDGQTLTLSGTVTGNARTGNWTTTPDATSTFRVVPSSDFIYYHPGNTTSIYRADIVATTLSWTTLTTFASGGVGPGGNIFWAPFVSPFSLTAFRGAGTTNIYRYDLGLQVSSTYTYPTSVWGAETMNTGASVCRIPYRGKFIIHIAATSRIYLYHPATGAIEPFSTLPYLAPTTYTGKNMRWIRSSDGIDFLYFARKGGQEYYRIVPEWLNF